MDSRYSSLDFDVIVIGGGPAGTVAAIAAARGGANVLLVERHGCLGGMLTAAGTGPMMSFHAGKTQVVRGIPDELVQRLVRGGFSPGHMDDFIGYAATITPFSAEGMKLVMEQMCLEAGVTLLYHTVFTGCTVRDGRIVSVSLFSKNGSFEARAKVFIDASADADLALAAGVPTVFGREKDRLAQPMSLNLLVGGVDREKVMAFVEVHRDEMYHGMLIDRLRELPRTGFSGGGKVMRKAREEGRTTLPNNGMLCFETDVPGQFIINMTHMPKLSAVDAFDLTAAEIDGRRQAHETFRFFKENIPGFENAHLIRTGPNIGIRESRRIVGEYILTAGDLVRSVMFPDTVAMGGYPIDIHSPDGKSSGPLPKLRRGAWYAVPYRCLIAKECTNLITSGRCISVTHEALGAVRVTPILMAVSQGAGSAAAMAALSNGDTLHVDTAALRERLRKDGAFLDAYMPAD